MLKKGEPTRFGDFGDRAQAACLQIKCKLASPPVLSLPRKCLPYVLDTDACDIQVGCVLMQFDDDKSLSPVGYRSRTLCSAKQNYDTTERYFLVIVLSVLPLRPYLQH